MSRRAYLLILLAVLTLAGTLRGVWLTADPPVIEPAGPVGIVWHDEGAWVHNARNRVLWGVWRTDEWNPMYLTPVFTALETAAFAVLGVGTWQARIVPIASGLAAILAMAWGLGALAGRRSAIAGALLLSTSYFFVMWNRAALIESTMTAAIAVSWGAYAAAMRRPVLGLLAGLACAAAFFSKAAAAFFVASLGLDAAFVIAAAYAPMLQRRVATPDRAQVHAAGWTIAGLVLGFAIAAIAFVGPNWTEYSFYTWQMSVTRKPDYTLRAFIDRASWLPVVHDVFSRMWLALVAGLLATLAIAADWRRSAPAARLLVLWILIGLAELVVHDTGNERRFVMFVPALTALAALYLTPSRPSDAPPSAPLPRWVALPVVLLFAYLVWGSVVRLFALDDIQDPFSRDLSWTVRVSAALAFATGVLAWWRWRAMASWLAAWRPSPRLAIAVIAAIVAIDLAQFGAWAASRTYLNYEASLAVGRWLPDGTLVHGKLANGLSLENRIRPIFIGRGFGNYADRLQREDVRYLLTYIMPTVGHEGAVIHDVLRHLPGHRIIQVIAVEETRFEDAAALIDKYPDRQGR